MDTHKNRTSEISTTYGETLKVTCVERRYKVIDSNAIFIIVAKRELDEDTTEKLLHEDMELKTFLANYEIGNITYLSPVGKDNQVENIKIGDIEFQRKNLPDTEKYGIGKSGVGKPGVGKSGLGRHITRKSEIGEPEIGKREESESVIKRRELIMMTLKRRELFDSLDLPEEFLVSDYTEAIEKNGIKISNSRISRDDLKWLEKMGKVKNNGKNDRGAIIYMLTKKSDKNHSGEVLDGVLPDNSSVNKNIS